MALSVLALTWSSGATASTVAPLPESDYATRNACQAPEPGHISCLALVLVAETAAARAHTHPLGMIRSRPIAAAKAAEGAFGLRPQDLQSAYFPGEAPDAPASEPQTIALVDAYNDPNAESDLNTYSKEFGLPECTQANGCFTQVNQNGETTSLPFPATAADLKAREVTCQQFVIETREERRERETACKEVEEAGGWALEISTDIEIAHAVCQNCKILLVESGPTEGALEEAEEAAAKLRASEISNSWGGPEPALEGKAFNHPGIAITAAAGDDGYLNWTAAEAAYAHKTTYYSGTDYPASSPNVVAVGGTKLALSSNDRWQSETTWNEDPGPEGGDRGAGGGGCSISFAAKPWQQAVPDWSEVGCEDRRAVSDISADADPYTGVAVFDSNHYTYEENGRKLTSVPGWVPIGGTSVASPIIAAIFALAGGAHAAYPAQTLYAHLGSRSLHDVTGGGNGKCDGAYLSCSGSMSPLSQFDCGQDAWICNAASGYDGPTGVGTPNGLDAFKPGASEPQAEDPSKAEETSQEEVTSPREDGEEQPSGAGNPVQRGRASSTSSSTSPSSKSTGAATTTTLPRISGLMLDRGALAALARNRPHPRRLRYSFTISASSQVHVTLTREVWVRGHWRWRTIIQAVVVASKGLNVRHLPVGALAAGRYRLKLSTATGASRSRAFGVGSVHR
ncbi:MAG: S8 family serine peptidase [Solirubrobacteraceae bacterium]